VIPRNSAWLWTRCSSLRGSRGQIQPRQPLLRERILLRRKRFRGVKRPDMDVDLVRPAVTFIGKRRTTLGAKAAQDAGRGGEAARAAAGEHQMVFGEARIGRYRRAGVAAAASAVAVARPLRRSL